MALQKAAQSGSAAKEGNEMDRSLTEGLTEILFAHIFEIQMQYFMI
jgi:hypothetical protein